MRNLRFLLRKEFTQIFRDKNILRIIFAMPLMQLILLPQAANFEMRNINLSIIDKDHSAYSQRFVQTMKASGYFVLTDYSVSYPQALQAIEQDKADLIIEIPQGFEKKLIKENESQLFIAVNAMNSRAVLSQKWKSSYT